jgi:hypothetical protein
LYHEQTQAIQEVKKSEEVKQEMEKEEKEEY